MIRLTLLGIGVVLGLAAWFGAAGGASPPATAPVVELALAQSDTGPRPGRWSGPIRDTLTLSPSMIGRCMAVAREVDPDLAARLDMIRRDRSEEDFRRAMGQARHLVGLVRLQEENPKLYGIKVAELHVHAQVDRTMDQLIGARRAGAPVDDYEQELERLVTQQVGYSLVARGMSLRRLNEHVKALRQELDHDLQPGNFGPAVQRRLQELLGRVDAAVD
ncbi:MAG: hypothetical protein V3S08_02765 [Phycisphaerales bacterium]